MLYTCKLLLLLLGYASGIAVGLAVIVILYTGFLMRSRGLTREDGRRGLKGFVVFFVCLFASIACFVGVHRLQQSHDRELIEGASALMAACELLGDAQPIPAPGKALVWDLKTDSWSKANDSLRSDLQAGWNDDMLIFLVRDSNASLLELDVWVVRWPQKEAIGKYTVRDSLTPAQHSS